MFFFTYLILQGCRPPSAPSAITRRSGAEEVITIIERQDVDPKADAIVTVAREYLGATRLYVETHAYRNDCSGFIEAIFAAVDIPYRGSVAQLYDIAAEEGLWHQRRIPSPGDLAFFDFTHDRNENGLVDDYMTHVAVVESVDLETGDLQLIHYAGGKVGRTYMNLRSPSLRQADDGHRVNSTLRLDRNYDAPGARMLTGELWAGFGSMWRGSTR